MRLAVFVLVVAVACARSDDRPGYIIDGSFVAEDAGQIPLTSPGTEVRTERPVVEVPFPPLEGIPEPVPEEPLDFEYDTLPDAPQPPSPPRQSRATDTIAIDTVEQTVPLVRPPAPPPVPPAGIRPQAPVPRPSVPRPSVPSPSVPRPSVPSPSPAPAPTDTGGGAIGVGGETGQQGS